MRRYLGRLVGVVLGVRHVSLAMRPIMSMPSMISICDANGKRRTTCKLFCRCTLLSCRCILLTLQICTANPAGLRCSITKRLLRTATFLQMLCNGSATLLQLRDPRNKFGPATVCAVADCSYSLRLQEPICNRLQKSRRGDAEKVVEKLHKILQMKLQEARGDSHFEENCDTVRSMGVSLPLILYNTAGLDTDRS